MSNRRAALLFSALLALSVPSFGAPKIPDRDRLSFDGFDWNLRKGDAQLPPLLRVKSRSRSANGFAYRVVKLAPGAGAASPIRAALRATGAEILGTIPPGAFLVRSKPENLAALAKVRGIADVAELPAAARIAPEIRNRMAAPGSAPVEIRVVLHPEESTSSLAPFLRSISGALRFDPPVPGRGTRIRESVPGAALADAVSEIASRPEVAFVEAFHPMKLHNSSGDWVHQTNRLDETPFYDDHHLYGCGEIVSISDTGFDLDSCYFVDETAGLPPVGDCTEAPCTSIPTNDAERKILAYYNWSGGSLGDDGPCNHGSHTLGSMTGNSTFSAVSCSDRTYANPKNGDGLAPGAKVIAEELGSGLDYINGFGGSIYELVGVAYEGGARVHTNSWGGGCCDNGHCLSGCLVAYDSDARDTDRITWENRDMLVLFSAGNDGGCCEGPNSVGSPGTAKNVLTVGATGHDFSATTRVGFSSNGGTVDGRVKPTVMGQGVQVISAESNGTIGTVNCSTCKMSGTSMATPTIAGAATQVREYLRRGFYPSGTEKPEDGLVAPSSALLRALLIAGGQHLANTGQQVPNLDEGFGRVHLESSLPVASGASRLYLSDEPHGLETGEVWSTSVAVSAGAPLRIALVSTDYPGTLGTGRALVDDLRLEVFDPTGTGWFVALDPVTGAPVATNDEELPGDDRNSEERLIFEDPAAGTWTIRVRGVSVPMGPQPFAVVAIGALTPCTPPSPVTGVTATVDGANRIRVSWSAGAGDAKYRVFRAEGSCGDPSLLATSGLGTTAETFFVDAAASGNIAYCYSVEALDESSGCTSARSPAPVVAATGDCLRAPSFAGAASASAASAADCSIEVHWSPGSASCPGFSTRYNVYRSLRPDFVPDAESLVAKCLAAASYVDRAGLVSGRTFHYIVRAEDSGNAQGGPCNGGREEGNLLRVFATPQNGEVRENGTFHDRGGDDVALMTADPAWRITGLHPFDGGFSWHNAPDGEVYAPALCTSLTTPPLPLTAGMPHQLSFQIDYNLEYQWDGLDVEISSDGGNSWAVLLPDVGYPETLRLTQGNGCDWPASRAVFSGPPRNEETTGWMQSDVPIPTDYDGRTVLIRFRMTSDSGLELDGVWLDEITVTNVQLPTACTPLPAAPTSRFAAEGWPACPGSPVTFVSTAAGASAWHWDFGDGGSSTEASSTHTFAGAGPFRVTLTAENAGGSSDHSSWYAPSCDTEGYRPLLALPGLARSEGAAGSFFVSKVWLANPGDSPLPLRLRFAPAAGSAAGSVSSFDVTLGAHEGVAYPDVLGTVFGVAGNSSGVVTVSGPAGSAVPLGSARTFNAAAADGTYGQYIAGIPLGDSAGLSSDASLLSGLSATETSRTNVGVVNPADSDLSATLELVDGTGAAVGASVGVTVPARAVRQVNGVAGVAGAGNLEPFTVRITAAGPYFAYASRLDNRTSDPIYVPNGLSAAKIQWIDGVARAAGASATFFRTTLSLTNPGNSATTVTARYTPRGAVSPTATASISLARFESRLFADVLTEPFGGIDGAGAISLESDEPVVAWARTYNDAPAGTYGQFIPAVSAEQLLPASGAYLLGLSEETGIRTNVGAFNRGSASVDVTFELVGSDGAVHGTKTESIPAGGSLFLSRYLSTLSGGTPVADFYLRVRPALSGAVSAWASVVDNGSGDAIFVRPMTR